MAVFCMTLAAATVNVIGKWDVTATGRNGQTYKMELEIKSARGQLSGTLSSGSGSTVIEDVKLEGRELTYKMKIGETPFQAKLTVSEGSLNGTYTGPNGKGGTIVAVPPGPPFATMSEGTFRHLAVSTVRPDFPQEALHAHQSGLAVAEVTVNEQGEISKIDIIEAAAPSLGKALEAAVKQWRFNPIISDGKPITLMSKITYYFLLVNGKPKVMSPDENFSVRQPER